MDALHELVQRSKEQVIAFRRDLHRIPETGFKEAKTSAYVAETLSKLDLDVQTGIATHGVVGLLRTGTPGPTLMIRADMDALPIAEETGLPFASTHPGCMHACGHDSHMAMALAAASVLSTLKERFRGNVKFVFQPAEEGPGGAQPMIAAGVMENPTVDYCLGCHLWAERPEGHIGIRPGVFMAAMDRFDIKITGKGGHGAQPHMCVDALEVGTQVVAALQRIVSRHIDPIEPVVVTVGSFHAGTAFNITPGEAVMSGTTRTFNAEIWKSWRDRIDRVVRGVCESMGAGYELNFSWGYPPTVNDATMSDVVRRCAAQVVGEERVVVPDLTMGGEDMSFFLQRAPGCYYCIGVGREGAAPLHNPKFDFKEDLMLLGVETHCRVALDLLS
ncbi:MAG: amidohydrolase [Desulfobacterales bacterium]|jgi:amidohydrolase|nr:amidohydrolase [Desulfobacterales bacterium]